ncbi:Phage Tail Protein X [compost metagenome]
MTYTTIQGDTWDGIAFKLYGDENLMPLLLNANQGQADTVIFAGGVVLNVPDTPEETASDLPPWKLEE